MKKKKKMKWLLQKVNPDLFQGLLRFRLIYQAMASESSVHFLSRAHRKVLECPSAVMNLKSTKVKFTKFLSAETLASAELHG